MSNQYDEFLDDTDGADGGTLRKRIEGLIKTLKEKDKALEEYSAKESQRSLNDLLTKAEVPARFHKLAARTLGKDVSEDSFKEFVTEYGDLWDAKEEELSPEQTEQQAAIEKMNSAGRAAKGLDKNEPYKMPSQHELARMTPTQLADEMAKAQAAAQ